MPEESHGSPAPAPNQIGSLPHPSNNKNNIMEGKLINKAQPWFHESCEDLKDHVYDSSSTRANVELFMNTTRVITEYMACEYSGAGNFQLGLQQMSLPDANNVVLK